MELGAELALGRSLWIDMSPNTSTAPDDPHCTLIFLGKSLTGDQLEQVLRLAEDSAYRTPSMAARIGGLARFRGSAREGDPMVWLLQAPDIRRVADSMRLNLTWARRGDFDYTPHVTLQRHPINLDVVVPPIDSLQPFALDRIRVCCGAAVRHFPMIGRYG